MAGNGSITAYKADQRGLTLIELLVVMAILALTASLVIVNAPPLRSPAREAAQAFVQSLDVALDDAVITGAVYRLDIDARGWRLQKRRGGAWRDALSSGDLGDQGVLVSVEVDQAAASNLEALTGLRPEKSRKGENASLKIGLDPFGDTPEFTVLFDFLGERWLVRQRADGRIETERGA